MLLYAIPVTVAIALLSLSIPERGTTWVFPTTLAAIVLSQVGALLTLLYYRRHAPPPADVEAAAERAAEALGGRSRAP